MAVTVTEVGDVLIADVGQLISGRTLNPDDRCEFYRDDFVKYLCDIRDCGKFDSRAIGNVAGLYSQLKPHHVTFKVLADARQVPLLKLTALDEVFDVFVDAKDALASFARAT